MRVKPEQLATQLAKPLRPLYCVHGDEPLLVLEAADQIRLAARTQGYTEREIHQAEGRFDWSGLVNIGSNLSLFADRRLIDIRIPSGKPGTDGSKALQNYCAALPLDTVTLVTLPKLDRSSSSAKWFTALEQAGVSIAIYPVGIEQLPRWIGERLAQQNQQADHDTLRFLSQKVEGNLLAAQQEIRKLALLFPGGPLSFSRVREAVLDVARYDVFKLTDALLMGDTARSIRILTGLRNEGEAATLILWAISRELRLLARLKNKQQGVAPTAQQMREIGVWENRQPLIEKALQKISLNALIAALHQAAAIDRMIKGLDSDDPWLALQRLVSNLSVPG